MDNLTLSRRALIGAGAAAAATLAVAEATPAMAATFDKGADIGWVPQMEANGYSWNNKSGTKQDILTILKGYGITAVRLRCWVNPSNNPTEGHCSTDETAAMAKRCKAAGFKVMIDMHFGDTWNSVGKQNPPAAWASQSYTQMKQSMSTYVFHLMNVLKANGVTPAWVQLGNEINSGICLPTGSLKYEPAQMTGLLNAAYDQVKGVFPSTPTIIHLAQPQNLSTMTGWFDTYKAQGGKWDICGFSSYASGTATIDGIVNNYKTIQSRYGKPIMQVEFGGDVNNPTRTKSDLSYVIQKVRGIGGLGVFYWEPEGYAPFTTYGMTAWDKNTRRPTAAMDGFLV